MKRFVLTACALALLGQMALAQAPPEDYNRIQEMNDRGIWDGHWTRGRSGLGNTIPDPGSSEGKSGADKDFMHYPIPTHKELNRHYFEVDRDRRQHTGEIKDYSQEALLQVRHPIRLEQERILGNGYYLVRLGDYYSGSEKTHLQGYNQPVMPQRTEEAQNGILGVPSAFVLEKQGRVVAMVPIERVDAYDRQKGQPKFKRPYAYLDYRDPHRGPWLRVIFKKHIYSAPLTEQLPPVAYPGQHENEAQLPPLRP